MKARGATDKREAILARHRDIKEQIDSSWRLKNEWGQIWIAALLAAISAISLRLLIQDLEKSVFGNTDAAPWIASGLAVMMFLWVVNARGIRMRKKGLTPKPLIRPGRVAERRVTVKPNPHVH
jgi:hypothetical protein